MGEKREEYSELVTLQHALENLQRENLELLSAKKMLEAELRNIREEIDVFRERRENQTACIEEMEQVLECKIEETEQLKQQVTELKAEIYDIEREKSEEKNC